MYQMATDKELFESSVPTNAQTYPHFKKVRWYSLYSLGLKSDWRDMFLWQFRGCFCLILFPHRQKFNANQIDR